MTNASFLKYIRLTHLYLGAFLAPALLFFAFTGALQTLGLHEGSRESSYKPPAWIVTLAQIHKKQTPFLPVRRFPPPPSAGERPHPENMPDGKPAEGKPHAEQRHEPESASVAPKPADPPAPKTHHTLPMKIFFLFVCAGLAFSTLLGVYMSYKFNRNARLVTALLIAGIVLPILLTLI